MAWYDDKTFVGADLYPMRISLIVLDLSTLLMTSLRPSTCNDDAGTSRNEPCFYQQFFSEIEDYHRMVSSGQQ